MAQSARETSLAVILPPDPMPVTPLGFGDGMFRFRAADGSEQQLPPAGLVHAPTLIALFGDDRWLQRNFPAQYLIVPQRAGGNHKVTFGIDVRAAAGFLARRCADAELARIPVLVRGTKRVSAWKRLRARLLDWLGRRQGAWRRVSAEPVRRGA